MAGFLKGGTGRIWVNGPDWELYRGDSFQLKIEVNEALLAAIHIKPVLNDIRV